MEKTIERIINMGVNENTLLNVWKKTEERADRKYE